MKNKPLIIQDTREQTPFHFSDKVEIIVDTLETGDYSLAGLESQFCIERKSIPDLYGCIFKTRFDNCLDRMKKMVYAEIIIEGTYKEVRYGLDTMVKRYSKANPASVMGKLLSIKSTGIHVSFIDKKESSKYCEHLLSYHWTQYFS